MRLRWSVRIVFGRRDIHERWAVSFASQKILAGPSDQPKQKGSAEGRHVDNPPIIRMGPVLEDEHARDQGDHRQPTTKPVPEVSQFSRHRSLTVASSWRTPAQLRACPYAVTHLHRQSLVALRLSRQLSKE